MIIDKTNANLLKAEEKVCKDGTGRHYIQVEVTFDKHPEHKSRINLFGEEYEMAKTLLPKIKDNNDRCGLFYKGNWETKDGKWVLWSGKKVQYEN